jgi:hypothetical protein
MSFKTEKILKKLPLFKGLKKENKRLVKLVRQLEYSVAYLESKLSYPSNVHIKKESKGEVIDLVSDDDEKLSIIDPSTLANVNVHASVGMDIENAESSSNEEVVSNAEEEEVVSNNAQEEEVSNAEEEEVVSNAEEEEEVVSNAEEEEEEVVSNAEEEEEAKEEDEEEEAKEEDEEEDAKEEEASDDATSTDMDVSTKHENSSASVSEGELEEEEEVVEEEVVEEEVVEEEVVEEEEEEEEVVEEEEEEEEEEEVVTTNDMEVAKEAEDEEVYEIEINGKPYYVTNQTNSIIYEEDENGDITKEVGAFINGKAVFTK